MNKNRQPCFFLSFTINKAEKHGLLSYFCSMTWRILLFLAAQFYTEASHCPLKIWLLFSLFHGIFQLQFPFQKRETFPENIPGIYFFKEQSPKKVSILLSFFRINPQYSNALPFLLNSWYFLCTTTETFRIIKETCRKKPAFSVILFGSNPLPSACIGRLICYSERS